MEQLVRVKETFSDGTAEVIRVRESACSGECHKCAGCGSKQQTMVLRAVNAISAAAGDMVILSSESAPVLKAAAILYVLPVALFFAGYALGQWLWHLGGLVGFAGFAAGLAIATAYDRRVAKKNQTVYTITGFAPQNRDGDL